MMWAGFRVRGCYHSKYTFSFLKKGALSTLTKVTKINLCSILISSAVIRSTLDGPSNMHRLGPIVPSHTRAVLIPSSTP